MRKLTFSDNEFYHIYNRGVDKRKIFLGYGYYLRFVKTIGNILATGTATQKEFIANPVPLNQKVELICYCLMPNHYHLLVRQAQENGITEFMHKLNTSYTKFFNINNQRSGRLFEYIFKAVHVQTDEQLLQLSRYIHLNPLVGGLDVDLNSYKWSSYVDYVGARKGKLCCREKIFGLLSSDQSEKKYEKFVLDQIGFSKNLENINMLILE